MNCLGGVRASSIKQSLGGYRQLPLRLTEFGKVTCFKAIKAATRQLADSLDHCFTNDIEPFDRITPSTENLPYWFYRQHQQPNTFNGDSVKVNAVTLWETDNACDRFLARSTYDHNQYRRHSRLRHFLTPCRMTFP